MSWSPPSELDSRPMKDQEQKRPHQSDSAEEEEDSSSGCRCLDALPPREKPGHHHRHLHHLRLPKETIASTEDGARVVDADEPYHGLLRKT